MDSLIVSLIVMVSVVAFVLSQEPKGEFAPVVVKVLEK